MASWSGGGSKTTDAFTASAPWRVRWSARPTRGTGSMMVTVRKSNGDIVTSIDSGQLSAPRSDVSTVHESGSFYLEINGFGAEWSVSIDR